MLVYLIIIDTNRTDSANVSVYQVYKAKDCPIICGSL